MTLPGFEPPPAKIPVLRMMAHHQRQIVAGTKLTTLRRSPLKARLYRMEGGYNAHTGLPVSLGHVRLWKDEGPQELWMKQGWLHGADGERLPPPLWPSLICWEGYEGKRPEFMELLRKWHLGWLSGEYPLYLHWIEFAGALP